MKEHVPKKAGEPAGGSADSNAGVDDKPASDLPGLQRGKRLRLALLVANVALSLICALIRLFSSDGYWNSGIMTLDTRIVIEGINAGLQIVHFAPMALVTLLAAWGPWRSWVRGLVLLGWIVADMVVHQAFNWWIGSGYRSNAAFWMETIDLILQILLLLVPAAFSLALVGSWMSLRIGPAELRPVRASILSVMIATAVLGAVMAAKLAVDRSYGHGAVYTLEAGETIVISGTHEEILLQIFYGGTLFALLLGLLAAAAYRWWAKALLALLISVYGGISYYFASQAAPQFPFGQTNILLVLYSGTIIGLIAGCFWVAINVRWLHRSGWPCSRRRRFVAAQR